MQEGINSPIETVVYSVLDYLVHKESRVENTNFKKIGKVAEDSILINSTQKIGSVFH